MNRQNRLASTPPPIDLGRPLLSAQNHKKPPRLIDERLVTALSHDTRAHALAVFGERPASSKELAAELGMSVSAVWYHVNKLLKLGCIELVESKKRRGSTERFYRATADHYFDTDAWRAVPEKKRQAILMRILRLIAADLDEALRADTVDTIDNHLSRTPLELDQKGWTDATAVVDGALEQLLVIRRMAAKRLAKSGETPIYASISIMEFELPSRKRG